MNMCPFLTPVTADLLWMLPQGVYCCRPGHRVRAPARSTLLQLCATRAHVTCAGYRTAAGSAPATPRPAPTRRR